MGHILNHLSIFFFFLFLDLQQENSRLKELLNNHETQKSADKQCLSAMQEIVASLTEYKLTATTKIDELENSLSKLRQQLIDSQTTAIENESLKRQIKRLTDENEELLSDQQALESQIQNSTNIGDTLNSNNEEIKQLTLSLETLKQELIVKNEYITKLEMDTTIERERTTNQHKNQTKKLQLYKTKILEVAGKLKQLKKGKEILSVTVEDYSKAVSKWQMEIVTVSSKLIEKIHTLQREKNELKLKNSQFEDMYRLQSIELSNLKQPNVNKDLPLDYQDKLTRLEEDNENKTKQLQDLQEKLLQSADDLSAYNQFKVNCDEALLSNKQLKFELNTNLLELEKKNKQLADIQHKIHNEYDKIRLDINNYKLKYNESLQIESELNTKVYALENENENKTKQLETVQHKLQELTDNFMQLEIKYNESIMNIESETATVLKLQNDIIEKENELKNLHQILQEKSSQLEVLTKKMELAEIELSNVHHNNLDTSNLLQQTLNELEDANKQLTMFKNESQDYTDSAKCQYANLEDKLNTVENELAEKSSSLAATKSELDSQIEMVTKKSKEITELLEEMRELNDALKNRGDVISKQKSKINEYEKDAEIHTKRIAELESTFNEKNLEIAKLVGEFEKINLNNGMQIFCGHFYIHF